MTIVFNNAMALADKVTNIASNSGLIAKADKVAVNFK